MSAYNEYVPSENGNGNGHTKAFKIGPADDPIKFKILSVRRRVQQWPGLDRSAKLYFDWILDLSLDPGENDKPGVVTISEKAAARRLGCHPRSVSRWKKTLVEVTGEIWLSKAYRPNMWPGDVYHISVLDPKKEDRQPTHDGIYGGGDTRNAPKAGMGCRKPGQKSLPLPGTKAAPKHDSTQVPDLAAETRQTCRLSADTDGGSQPTRMAADSRHGWRLTADRNGGSEPTEMAADSRQDCKPTAATNGAHKRVSVKRRETTQVNGEGEPPRDSAFDAWVKRIQRGLPSSWERLRTEFKGKLATVKTVAARADYKRRLAAVEELMFGPPINDESPPPTPKAPAPVLPPIAPEEIKRGWQAVKEAL